MTTADGLIGVVGADRRRRAARGRRRGRPVAVDTASARCGAYTHLEASRSTGPCSASASRRSSSFSWRSQSCSRTGRRRTASRVARTCSRPAGRGSRPRPRRPGSRCRQSRACGSRSIRAATSARCRSVRRPSARSWPSWWWSRPSSSARVSTPSSPTRRYTGGTGTTRCWATTGASPTSRSRRPGKLLDRDPLRGRRGAGRPSTTCSSTARPYRCSARRPNAAVAPPLLSGHALEAPNQVVLGRDDARAAAQAPRRHGRVRQRRVETHAPRHRRDRHPARHRVAREPAPGDRDRRRDLRDPHPGRRPRLRRPARQPRGDPRSASAPDANPAAARRSLQRIADRGERSRARPTRRSSPCSGPPRSSTTARWATRPRCSARRSQPARSRRSALTLFASVRRRRRDLALLKTLGFTRRQLAATVAWQASIAVALGVIVGVPLGIVARPRAVEPVRRRAPRRSRSRPFPRSRSRSSPSARSCSPTSSPRSRAAKPQRTRDRGPPARRIKACADEGAPTRVPVGRRSRDCRAVRPRRRRAAASRAARRARSPRRPRPRSVSAPGST